MSEYKLKSLFMVMNLNQIHWLILDFLLEQLDLVQLKKI